MKPSKINLFRTIYAVKDEKDSPKRCHLWQRYGYDAVKCTNNLVFSAYGLQYRHSNNECKIRTILFAIIAREVITEKVFFCVLKNGN